ncbi:uncharacterized protein BXIN_1860 [Babesia sp. Xinjiang]|uniref:uncharacterized protein n=1 Tax=Babesia sp. Xinjiang TaxID=462227 RepID=UPI000A25D9AC|nr:uncharacterized protein BXIN_1860 [Babesia sp. Xinjiang]ORM40402.1 hypothetical protein BXIN_1860 [Babesia sp. Xinjiang]
MSRLDDILGDPDASDACRQLLDCYSADLGIDVLTRMPDVKVASSSFLSQLSGKSAEHVSSTLENLSHALLIVKALRHKAVLNNTSDIIESVGEVNNFMSRLDDVTGSVSHLQDSVELRYGRSIALYKGLSNDISCIDGMCDVQACVVECMDILTCIRTLQCELECLGTTLKDLAVLLNISRKLGQVILRLKSVESSAVRDLIMRYCCELKSEVFDRAFEVGVCPVIILSEKTGSDTCDYDGCMKTLSICHHIFRELGVAPDCALRLVDHMVASTGRCIDLSRLVVSGSFTQMWQQFFISQLAEFMAKYRSCLIALYTYCRAVDYRLLDHLDDEEKRSLKSLNILSHTSHVLTNPLEVFAACELYAKRAVGLIQTALTHIESQYKATDLFDVEMLVPQLITMGECTHAELSHLNIRFNLHAYYFKTVCEKYAKEFMTRAAEHLLPSSKTVFSVWVKVLQQHGVNSMKELSPSMELQVASAVLHQIPVDDTLAHIIYEFLDKSHCCETLHQYVLQIANSALQNILESAEALSTVSGSRLMLGDGGSKISLKRPTDAHLLNVRIHRYITSLVGILEPCMARSVDLESPLFQTLQACKNIDPIEHWSDDVGATLWHTVSYVSSGGCQEFGWFVHQVLTATQHMVKICKFLRENYFNQLVPSGRMKVFRRLSAHAIASFVIYAITVWPLDEDDKMALLGVMTELEMELAEISKESLSKPESDYLAAFRRLIYLGDELFDILQTPDFQAHTCLWLPIDVISLHVMARIVNSPQLPSTAREELAQTPLHKFLGHESTHAMLSKFHDKMLNYRPDSPTQPTLGNRLSQYLQGFPSLEPILSSELKHAFSLLNTH